MVRVGLGMRTVPDEPEEVWLGVELRLRLG